MEDIFKKYKKHKVIEGSVIIFCSLFLAIGVNLNLDSSNFGKYMKSSVMDTSINTESKADIYLEKKGNYLELKNGNKISNLKNLNFSIVYNPESVMVLNAENNIDKVDINIIINNNGISSFIVNTKEKIDLEANSTIAIIELTKKEDNVEYINIVNGNFSDRENNLYKLSASGTDI